MQDSCATLVNSALTKNALSAVVFAASSSSAGVGKNGSVESSTTTAAHFY